MADFKNVKPETLERWHKTLAQHRASLDLVANESDRLSAEAQMELARVRRGLRLDHDAVTAELAVRTRMMPAPLVEEVARVA